MKRLALLTLLGISAVSAWSQNLVQNPSLEFYTTCPNTASQLTYAVGWNNSMNSPEYLHSCSNSIYSDVPTNYFGFQNAATSNAYGGGLFYGSFASNYLADIREHLYVQLTTPLAIGTTYYLAFKCNLVDNSEYAINRMGMQFTTSWNGSYGIINSAHMYSTAVIADKVNWVQVVGSFVPTQAYNAVMIGNFFSDANTTVQFVGSSVDIGYNAYYFIDDVYVGTTPVILPITWRNVGADVNGRLANLHWELEAEDIVTYAVEVSEDGYQFSESQQFAATEGKYAYDHIDTMRSHLPTSFYRIRAFDRAGASYLSPVIEATRYETGLNFLRAYPSALGQGDLLTIEYNSTRDEVVDLQFLSVEGRLVRTERLPATLGHQELRLPLGDLSAGTYLLRAGTLSQKIMVTE
jgi:hypothetical protein